MNFTCSKSSGQRLLPQTMALAALAVNLSNANQAEAASWATVGSVMKTPRSYHTATLLSNGKVLVAGGLSESFGTAIGGAELYDPTTGTWRTTGSLNAARGFHTATLLPGGKVLVVGGAGDTDDLSSAELYDPATGRWTTTGSMSVTRSFHTATLLPNGSVLVAGGGTNTAELYNPASGAWTMAGVMSIERSGQTATLLPSGKVLIAGGADTNSVELYDPISAAWSLTGPLSTPRYSPSATLLPGGQVLIVGGDTNSSELYNPSSGAWTLTGVMDAPRQTATLLPNGQVLATGGYVLNRGVTNGALLYNPATGLWTNTASMNTSRQYHTATLLPNGQLLVAGGYDNASHDQASAEVYNWAAGAWATADSQTIPRRDHTANLLPNGRVLVAGGSTDNLGTDLRASADLYDPNAGIWTATGTMSSPRSGHTATLLPNGKVLVAGGDYTNANPGGANLFPTATAELYDWATGAWTPTGVMNTPRDSHTATLLPSGKVLVAGGYDGSRPRGSQTFPSAELYDPASRSWTFTGAMNTPRSEHTATLLPSGKVLVAGGSNDGDAWLSSGELYDPATGTWTETDTLYTPRYGHTATLLATGKVLVAGGDSPDGASSSAAESYDPATQAWTPTGLMTVGRTYFTSVLLPNGIVLAAGGWGPFATLTNAELYNPLTGLWIAAAPMSTNRGSQSATLLPSGKILIVGGLASSGAVAGAELYDEGLGYSAAWQAQIATASSPAPSGSSLTLTGLRFRGVSQGSSGNAQDSPGDFPLVQLRGLESGQMIFQPATTWSTNFFASAPLTGLFSGYAMATVFVNGIPSTAALFLEAKGNASVTLSSLSQTYDGTAKFPSVSTIPPGLAVSLTYNGSANAPTNVGSYTIVATVQDLYYQGSATNMMVINKATATISLSNLSQTYDGAAKVVSASATPPGLSVDLIYNGSASPPTNAGNYTVIATINDPFYQGIAADTLRVSKTGGTVSLSSLLQSYDGSARNVTALTAPPGLAVSFSYSSTNYSSVNPPTNAGSYLVVGTISDVNYQGSISGFLTVTRANATVILTNLNQTYDGTAKGATAATVPAGLAVTLTYNGLPSAPTNAGTFSVVAAISDPNYQGNANGVLVVSPAGATVSLGNLFQIYDGAAKAVSVFTAPTGLALTVIYNGSTNPPIKPGSYNVIASIADPNYLGGATNKLLIGATNNSLLVPIFPGTPPDTSGSLRVTLIPADLGGQWRFPWELGWHNSGDLITNLAQDNYPIEFRQLPGYTISPLSQAVPVQAHAGTTLITNQYVPSGGGGGGLGWLTVDLGPNTVPSPGWRLVGEAAFHSSGATVSGLAPGAYVIEFSAVTNWASPSRRSVKVFADQGTEPLPIYYQLVAALPTNVILPSPLAGVGAIQAGLTNVPLLPYAFNGQLQSEAGLASGVAVSSNVVLTAAHVVFNDETLSYNSTVYWFFQEEAAEFDPKPLTARGWNVLSSYASARTNDLTVLTNLYSPGVSSPESRNWDVAALYFDSPAARGGYGGYLSTDSDTNEWLTSGLAKMLIGYPVDGQSFGDYAIQPGRMHATVASNFTFLSQSSRVYASGDFLSFPGNSGGPLCVLFADGIYYPAGVYLGSLGALSVVRSIDSNVVGLIIRSAVLGDQGTNFTGGGVITIVPGGTLSAVNPGYLQVRLGPPAAVAAGAGWRRAGDTAPFYTDANFTIAVTSTNGFALEFNTNVVGWNPPPSRAVQLAPGLLSTVDGTYSVRPPVLVFLRGLGLGMTGTVGTAYQIQRRDSLAGGNWTVVSTNLIGPGLNLLSGWPPSNGPSSIYRAVWLP